ncbi:MAG: glycosyl transferase [Gammaproteobacteria bacterium]|nr:glycosyl transferase [Gammaproteobacteria bacterium]|tara:strand:- start:22919 stop:24001 length:1083 start_codon:yes stop_codon:yes gene_type:complete
MKKILAICTSPDIGGLELYFTKMVNYYKDNSVSAVCRKNSEIEKRIPDSRIAISKISIFNILYYALKISKFINQNKIDVIHVSWSKDILFSVLIKILSKQKLLLIYYRQMKITRYKNDFYHSFLFKYIDLVLVITQKLKIEAQKYYPIKNNKIQILTYGIYKPTEIDIHGKNQYFEKINLNTSLFTIGLFSRVEEQKGQHLVIDAIKELKSEEIQLLSIGHVMDENYKSKLDKLIADNDLKRYIRFINFINEPMKIMPYVDLIILPTYEETFGLVLAEAMIMQVPVIGSNAGGVPEIIEDGQNGLLFEPKNSKDLSRKILKIKTDTLLRKNFSKKGKAFADIKYNYDLHFQTINKYLDTL